MLKRLAVLTSTAAMMVLVACAQTDPGITTAVKAKLAADETVKAYQIDVDTARGVVTLSGAVETSTAKEQALMIARGTDGVQDVVDRITVDPQTAATTGDLREGADEAGAVVTDATVTSAVKAKFLADTAVSGLKIDVDTRDGSVTLNGMVPTQAEVDRAVSLARETSGVKSVVNQLRVGR